MSNKHRNGFTLIELSITLVIIGLIVGGILVGRDLIHAAEVRSTVAQMEGYNAAVRTFQLKYNCLPGDCAEATNYGFAPRELPSPDGSLQPDDGLLGNVGTGGTNESDGDSGEKALFWRDLSEARLINNSFSLATPYTDTGGTIDQYFPSTKAGIGTYVFVGNDSAYNYFILLGATLSGGSIFTNYSLSAHDAYDIDAKMDDGMPLTGRLRSVNGDGGSGTEFYLQTISPDTGSHAADGTNCYDNGSGASANSIYSTETPTNANAINCGLSLQFQ